jgi:hypothetical protein
MCAIGQLNSGDLRSLRSSSTASISGYSVVSTMATAEPTVAALAAVSLQDREDKSETPSRNLKVQQQKEQVGPTSIAEEEGAPFLLSTLHAHDRQSVLSLVTDERHLYSGSQVGDIHVRLCFGLTWDGLS